MKAFVYNRNDLLGPYSEKEILEGLRAFQFNWTDWSWVTGNELQWVRLCDQPEFKSSLPSAPDSSILRDLKNRFGSDLKTQSHASLSKVGLKVKDVWYLQFEGSEFGPMSIQEVAVVAKNRSFKGKLYAWREGLDDWTKISEIPELADLLSLGKSKSGNERRKKARSTLLATIRFGMAGDSRNSTGAMFTGICRDISASGLQIVSSRAPGGENSVFELEVIPSGDERMLPFRAQAEVVRILSDGKGFSAKFRNLSEEQIEALETYLMTRAK